MARSVAARLKIWAGQLEAVEGGGGARSLARGSYSSSLCALLASPCSIVGQSEKRREGEKRRGHDLSPTKTVFHYFFCCFANAVDVVLSVRYFGAPNLQGASAALQRLPCIFGLNSIEPPGALMAARVVIYMTDARTQLRVLSGTLPSVPSLK